MGSLARLQIWLTGRELVIATWMARHGHRLLRLSLALVFIWFGALKPFGVSPAEELVAKATAWIPVPGFLYVLTAWEITIGVCFLFERLTRVAVVLLLLHMPGTLMPLVTLPEDTFVKFPFVLTLEGQYIIKNLVLIAAGVVLGGQLAHRRRSPMRGLSVGLQTLLGRGRLGVARPGELLAREGERMAEILFLRSGGGVVRVGDREVGRVARDQFIGEMSFWTDATAAATVEATAVSHYVAWDRDQLRALIAREQRLERALLESVNLDLVGKIQRANAPVAAVADAGTSSSA